MTKQNNTLIFTLVHSRAPHPLPPSPLCCSAAVFISLTAAAALPGGGDVRKDTPSLKGCRLNDGSVNTHGFGRRGALSAGFGGDWWNDAHASQQQKKKKISHSVAHISGSAFKEKVSSDCRQKLPQTPSYLCNYGQLISLTIKDASRIKDAAGLLKRFQRVARVCSAHTEGALWRPGRELSLWRGAEESNIQLRAGFAEPQRERML